MILRRSIAREIKDDTEQFRNDTTVIKEDTAHIIAEIARLQVRLPEGERAGGTGHGFALQRYLDNLTSYAESSWEMSDDESTYNSSSEDCHKIAGGIRVWFTPEPDTTLGQ